MIRMELVGVNLDFYPVPLFSDCGSSMAASIPTPGHLAKTASAGFDKVDFYAVFSQDCVLEYTQVYFIFRFSCFSVLAKEIEVPGYFMRRLMVADLLLFITMTGCWVCGPRDTVVMMDSVAAQVSTMVSLIFFDASHLFDVLFLRLR